MRFNEQRLNTILNNPQAAEMHEISSLVQFALDNVEFFEASMIHEDMEDVASFDELDVLEDDAELILVATDEVEPYRSGFDEDWVLENFGNSTVNEGDTATILKGELTPDKFLDGWDPVPWDSDMTEQEHYEAAYEDYLFEYFTIKV